MEAGRNASLECAAGGGDCEAEDDDGVEADDEECHP